LVYEIARKVKTLKVIILGTGARESTAITAGRWLRENPCTFELLLFRFFNLVDRAGGAATAHLTSGAPAHLFYSVHFGPGSHAGNGWMRRHESPGPCFAGSHVGGATESAERATGTLRQRPLIEIGRPYCRQSLAPYKAFGF